LSLRPGSQSGIVQPMKRTVLIACLLGVWLLPLKVQAMMNPHLKIQDYLNSLTLMTATFQQSSSIGDHATGTFYLDKRDGDFPMMTLRYNPPSPVVLYGRGNQLIFHDKSTEQTSTFDINETPAGIFMQPKISLNKDLVMRDLVVMPGRLETTLTLPELKDTVAELQLAFAVGENDALALKEWTLVDMQGVVTHISFVDVDTKSAIPEDKFEFFDPKFYKLRRD